MPPLGCPPKGHLREPAVSAFAGGTTRCESGHGAQLDCVGFTVSRLFLSLRQVFCMGVTG